MKRITLTDLKDDRKIVAIKNLRAVTGLGLKESKDIVDRMSAPQMRTTEDISVLDSANVRTLDESFVYTLPDDKTIPAGLVLEFVLDVLSSTDPVTARSLMCLPSYTRIAESL